MVVCNYAYFQMCKIKKKKKKKNLEGVKFKLNYEIEPFQIEKILFFLIGNWTEMETPNCPYLAPLPTLFKEKKWRGKINMKYRIR